MDVKIKVGLPKARRPKVMLWTDVSYRDMEQIDKTQSLPDLESTLSRVFGVDLPEPKRGALLELYVNTVLFCRKSSFNKEQTSALLSIMKSVHEANAETPLNNIEDCFKYCKELLLCHSVRRPPFSINLFSPEEGDCVIKYIYNSYVRHYKLYKYIFTPQVSLDLSLTYMNQAESNEEDLSFKDAESVEEPVAEEPSSREAPDELNTEPEDTRQQQHNNNRAEK